MAVLEKNINTDKTLGPGPDAGRTGTDTQSKALSSGHLIRTYCETIKEQPNQGLPSIITTTAPDFLRHLNTAQGNASHYINDIQPVMLQNVSDLMSFSNTWKSFTPQMKEYTAKGDYETVAQGLKIMQTKVKNFAINANNSHSVLLNFQNTITGDSRAFSNDYKLLMSSSTGIPAEIKALDKEIDAEHTALIEDIAMVAGGAAAAVLGGVLIVGGVLTEVFTAGASTVIIAAGVLTASGGIALITVGAIGIDKASKALKKANEEKATLNQELTSLKVYCSTVDGLRASVNNAVGALGNLATSWDYIYEDMNAVISDLNTAKTTMHLPWFDSVLNEADADWAQVGAMAKAVQLQTIESSYKKVDLSKPGASLLDALPEKEKEEIRSEEARKYSG